MRGYQRYQLKIWVIFLLLLLLVGCFLLFWKRTPDARGYSAEDFGIETIHSPNDKDQDGIDDYTDILLGAKAEAKRHPKYKSAYYSGGYPPENEGVCTDVIWRAFEDAGYSLKDMVDQDIAEHMEEYPRVMEIGKPDPNIDFRRVKNLKVFFERNAQSLTTDLEDIAAWQPGDIVVFEESHIGIVSDLRNEKGVPYLIHNTGQRQFEEDVLESYHRFTPISGHFRFCPQAS